MKCNNMNQNNASSTAKSGGRKLRNDIIFIATLLAVVICLGLGIYLLRPEGDFVVVTVDGVEYGRYPLHTDTTVEIRTGENGEQRNLLVIQDGKAFVESADCPDAICTAHRPIDGTRESIICLPHGVVITVSRVGDADAPDVIV